MSGRLQGVRTHAILVRVSHWLMAIAVVALMLSGWRIHNAGTVFGVTLPELLVPWTADPAGLAAALSWHFAAMWCLLVGFILCLAWGLGSGHFRRDLLPVRPAEVGRDLALLLRLRLSIRLTRYGAAQRAFYWAALAAVMLAIASGLVLYKPVQSYPLELLFGGYRGARMAHFLAMLALTGFLVIHLAMALLRPRALKAMVTGSAFDL